MTYRELAERFLGKKAEQFNSKLVTVARSASPSIMILIPGDNNFSLKERDGLIVTHYEKSEIEAHPKMFANQWIKTATNQAKVCELSNIVMYLVIPRFFLGPLQSADTVPMPSGFQRRCRKSRDKARAARRQQHSPWILGNNFHNKLADIINAQLQEELGVGRWQSRDGVQVALLDTNPKLINQPSYFREGRDKASKPLKDCVHPTARTFDEFYVQPLQKLLLHLD